MVPAYAKGGVVLSSLVMPVGYFQFSSLPASHAPISLPVICSHAVVPNFFFVCSCYSFVPLVRERVAETERHSVKQWGNSTSL